MGDEDKKQEGNTYPTDDLYYIAAVKALMGIIYDELIVVEADMYGRKEKCVAIYNNQKLLPAPSKIKMSFGTKEVTLKEFTEAFIQCKREMFRVMDERNKTPD